MNRRLSWGVYDALSLFSDTWRDSSYLRVNVCRLGAGVMTTPPAPAASPAPASPSPAGGPSPEAPPGGGSGAPPAESHAGAGEPGGASDGGQPQPENHGVGSGEAAAEATSRPGQGSLRNEYLREADRLSVEGDLIGRDKNIFLIGGTQRVRLRRLAGRQLKPVRRAFVPPDGLDEIRAGFEKNRAIILRGPDGCGKQALAIRMLIDLNPTSSLFQLDSAVDLVQLAELIETDLKGRDRIEQGAGFLLNQPANFGRLYGSVLQNLDDALDRADARLVLTVSSGTPVPDQDLLDYVVNVNSVPKYDNIVASHLRLLSPDQADLLLARSDVREFIEARLAADASCKVAADLAEAIASAADAADDEDGLDIEKIRIWDEQRGAEGFDTWFVGLGDTRTRSFAVALAVLNGLPYDEVAHAARALYRAFDRPQYMVMASADDVQPEGSRPFRMSRNEWLQKLRAKIKESEIQGVYGRSITETVEYQNPDYALMVIRRAWSDYEVQDALIGWLGQLAKDATEQVRIFAGIALGRLAIWSFDFLSCNVLEQWANGTIREKREAVAYALRVVAANPRLRGNARQLMSGWYAASSRPLAQATAARAYGVAFGPIDASEAFRQLDRLFEVDDIRVATAIGDSIADLLEAGDDEIAGMVLSRLAESVAEPGRSATAQLVFLIAADGLVDREHDTAGEGPASWPSLLSLTTRLAAVRNAIVRLWQYVLNEALFHEEAGQVMTRWAATAEGSPAIREAFLRLARAIARGDRRSLMILERYCAQWTSADNLSPLPAVSAALQTILTAEKEAR